MGGRRHPKGKPYKKLKKEAKKQTNKKLENTRDRRPGYSRELNEGTRRRRRRRRRRRAMVVDSPTGGRLLCVRIDWRSN